jgi:hypothetical protein
MSWDEIIGLGAVLSPWFSIAAMIGAGYGFFKLGKHQLQKYELETQQYKSEMALNIEVTPAFLIKLKIGF